MLNWQVYTEFFIAVFVALNPIGNIAFFLSLTGHQDAVEKKRTALVAALAVAVTVVATIWLGQHVLEAFGISIGSFRMGAGIVLLLSGLHMVKNGADTPKSEDNQPVKRNIAVVPLGIPIVAGPATLSVIIAQTENVPGLLDQFMYTATGLTAVLINYFIFVFAVPIGRLLGKEGINIATRIIGLILMAIAMESMSKGAKLLFPGLA